MCSSGESLRIALHHSFLEMASVNETRAAKEINTLFNAAINSFRVTFFMDLFVARAMNVQLLPTSFPETSCEIHATSAKSQGQTFVHPSAVRLSVRPPGGRRTPLKRQRRELPVKFISGGGIQT